MALATETSFQNKILALAIILISFPGQDAEQRDRREKASVIPFCYALFTVIINLSWGVVGWKCLVSECGP